MRAKRCWNRRATSRWPGRRMPMYGAIPFCRDRFKPRLALSGMPQSRSRSRSRTSRVSTAVGNIASSWTSFDPSGKANVTLLASARNRHLALRDSGKNSGKDVLATPQERRSPLPRPCDDVLAGTIADLIPSIRLPFHHARHPRPTALLRVPPLAQKRNLRPHARSRDQQALRRRAADHSWASST